MKRFLMTMFLILTFVTQVFSLPGAKSWIAVWDANTDKDLAGYYFYYRSTTQEFSNDRRIDCGLNTTQPLTGIIPNGSFITVVAYDTSAGESEFCDELFFDKDSNPPVNVNGFGIIAVD